LDRVFQSFDRDRELERGETVLLRELLYAPDDKCVTLRTNDQTYKLDARKVDPRELSAMCVIFRKMNFDFDHPVDGRVNQRLPNRLSLLYGTLDLATRVTPRPSEKYHRRPACAAE
jgi:hypothetical protein